MIDRSVLRQLGWSDSLIDALCQAAEPLRGSVILHDLQVPIIRTQPVSTTAIYSEVVANNTFRAVTVSTLDEEKRVGR